MKIFNIVCGFNNIERQSLKKVKKPHPTNCLKTKNINFLSESLSIKKCDEDNRTTRYEYSLWVTH
ncbi:hypothetical protein B9P84_02240 [Citrobacter braakii]|nr:hypothetical protein B9P84_02240 [Citrobacter braakii]